MHNQFKGGAVIARGKWYENAVYDVSNASISAAFSGSGTVTRYFIANGEKYEFENSFLSIAYNGVVQDVLLDKTVSMLGRCQRVQLDLKTAVLEILHFLDPKENGVFTSYCLRSDHPEDRLEICLTGYRFEPDFVHSGTLLSDSGKGFAADGIFDYCPDNTSIRFSLSARAPRVNTVLVCGNCPGKAAEYVLHFDEHFRALELEQSRISLPEGLDETEQALFYATYYCALENYKELGEYRGFMAGCNYLSPMRSYYRDSYFTVLPMYHGQTEKVRAQILTLARGIGPDGTCPSAVKSDWSAWWGNHYDSPSFLAMMLWDYIKFTGDGAFADTPVGGGTVFSQAVRALESLSQFADETGLLYKAGKYNKRDWADEVNRYGYVTYDEILYARALDCISRICLLRGDGAGHRAYAARFNQVSDAINRILWDNDLGYYVNFKSRDYTETNLSVDTVFAAIFGIADDARARRMLSTMERLLESQNNGIPRPFGCMCVYPFYSRLESAYHKSSQSFNYHNGANWPYLTAMYAWAKRKYGMDYRYLLKQWFEYNLNKGNYTPIEYFYPYCADGYLLQAWSGDTAFVLDEALSLHFWD